MLNQRKNYYASLRVNEQLVRRDGRQERDERNKRKTRETRDRQETRETRHNNSPQLKS